MRILFVDDEPLTLQGLQRMLRSSRGIWEMAFAAGGAQALDLMSRSSFDMIVSDMLMPGMNGAALLNEVRKQHPATARFVLSGHAERSLVLQSAVTAHQYLSKPCNPDLLKARLVRAGELLGSIEGNEMLRRSITQMDRFPIVPNLYTGLVEQLHKPDAPVERIEEFFSKDIGLNAFILKLVNSAFFGSSRESADATEAIALIGLETIKALAFSENAFSTFDEVVFREKSFDQLWKHSIDVASASRRIAEIEGAGPEIVQCAFVAGLLHDAGKFLLKIHCDDLFQHATGIAAERNVGTWIVEREVMNISHAGAAAYLFGLWGLPRGVVEAIAWHHTPARSGLNHFSAVTAVHAANALLHRRNGAADKSADSEIDLEHVKSVGLESRVSAWSDAID